MTNKVKFEMPMNVKMQGIFRLVTEGPTRGRIDHGEHKNLILNGGFAQLLQDTADNNVLRYISVGSGSSTPVVTQSSLDTLIATTNRNDSYTYGYVPEDPGVLDAYGRTIFEVQFDQGDAAGNISEMGVGWMSDGTNLWSRALIKDGGGSPTTITVLPDEFLTVTYELRRFVSPDWSGVINWDNDGTPTATTCDWTAGVDNTNLGNGSGGNFTFSSKPTLADSDVIFDSLVGLYAVNWRIHYGLTVGNPTISQAFLNNGGVAGQLIPKGSSVTFTPPLPKTNEYEIDINMLLTVTQV